MTNQEIIEINIGVVNSYWAELTPINAIKECGEFIQALSECIRWFNQMKEKTHNEISNYEYDMENQLIAKLVEEIGDVYVAIKALMLGYCITDKQIEDGILAKLDMKK